jgi:serine/threonine-protein kinase
VQADSIDQLLPRLRDARRIDWRNGLHVAYQVARALEFVHGRHLMHANITPRNILYQEGTRQAKLADLMLTKALEGSALQQRILEAKFLAELPYLAPEQVESGAYVDNLCDIYSLGAVIYALVTGRPPFTGDTPDEVASRIRSEPPEHPKIHQRSIPGAFDRIIMKMLAKQQIDRYPSPTALMEDLEKVAEEQDEPLGASEKSLP